MNSKRSNSIKAGPYSITTSSTTMTRKSCMSLSHAYFHWYLMIFSRQERLMLWIDDRTCGNGSHGFQALLDSRRYSCITEVFLETKIDEIFRFLWWIRTIREFSLSQITRKSSEHCRIIRKSVQISVEKNLQTMESLTIKPPQRWLASHTGWWRWWPSQMRQGVMMEDLGHWVLVRSTIPGAGFESG